jgi:hypothetical protein
VSQSVAEVLKVQPSATVELVSADRDDERPCDRNKIMSGMARCPTVQCITVCGGLPAATFTIAPPLSGTEEHASAADDPSRGISTIPDLPPPRPSA